MQNGPTFCAQTVCQQRPLSSEFAINRYMVAHANAPTKPSAASRLPVLPSLSGVPYHPTSRPAAQEPGCPACTHRRRTVSRRRGRPTRGHYSAGPCQGRVSVFGHRRPRSHCSRPRPYGGGAPASIAALMILFRRVVATMVARCAAPLCAWCGDRLNIITGIDGAS